MSIGYYKFIYLFITSYIIIKNFILFLLSKYHTKITNNIYHNKIYIFFIIISNSYTITNIKLFIYIFYNFIFKS